MINKRTMGDVYKSPDGYIYIWKPNHPYCSNVGYIAEHRLIMESFLGRYLTKKERVHHIDFNKRNNHLDNLHLFLNMSKHQAYHRFLQSIVLELIGYKYKYKGKIKEYNRLKTKESYQRHKNKNQKKGREYYYKNKDKVKEYQIKNKKEIRKYQKEYRQKKKQEIESKIIPPSKDGGF